LITEEREATPLPTSSIRHSRITVSISPIWKEALLPYLVSRILLVLVGLLADFYILPLLKSNPLLSPVDLNTHFPEALWLMWKHFDAGFYVDIAEHGYWAASTLRTTSNWIFLPLYPMLIYPLGHLLGDSDFAYDIAGVLVSNIAGLVAVTYLYLLVRREFSSHIATRTVLYLAIFPTSFYLSAIYPESVFLAGSLACIYYARQRRWWLAGICGALVSLTRIQGFLLVVPVAWEYWQAMSDRYILLPDMSSMRLQEKIHAWLLSRLQGPSEAALEFRNWSNLIAVALIPLGLLPFLLYSEIKTGDLLATIHNHHVGWGRFIELPWQLLAFALSHPQPPNPLNWNFWLLNIITIFVYLGFTFWSWRRLPMIYTLYTLLMVLMPLSTASINSISRYYMVIFPVLILLALWSIHDNQQTRHFMILSFFAVLQAVFMIFFVLGLPLIA
jgi:Dolichyl-phosphate-mannose-protein mannosyltransferase